MKHIFSIPKVWEFPELRVQPGWQQVSRGRSRKEVMGDEITPHRRRLLLGISTHLFSLSLWLFVLSSDFPFAPSARGPDGSHTLCSESWQGSRCLSCVTANTDQVKLPHSQHMVHPAQGWDCSRYLQIHTVQDPRILFFLQESDCHSLSTASRERRQCSDTWQRTDALHFPWCAMPDGKESWWAKDRRLLFPLWFSLAVCD